MKNAIDILIEKIKQTNNPTVMGLDPRYEMLPKCVVEKYPKTLEGVAEAIASIRTAQDEYMKANSNKGVSASSFNKPIVSLVNDKLVPYLNAMVIAGNANCMDFAKSVEAEINRVNDMIAKRGKRS